MIIKKGDISSTEDATLIIVTDGEIKRVQVFPELTEAAQEKRDKYQGYLADGLEQGYIPALTNDIKEYLREYGYDFEINALKDYIELKAKTVDIPHYIPRRISYVNDYRDYVEKNDMNLTIAKNLDERLSSFIRMVDKIYNDEIYGSKHWLRLDPESKGEWANIDGELLTESESQHVAAEAILKNLFEVFTT